VWLVGFAVRGPVLLFSDSGFDTLYGTNRALFQRVSLSLKQWRRIKVISLADDADLAAVKVDGKPFCVIVPARYESIARSYREEFPESKVAIIGGGTEDSGIPRVLTDRSTTLYRAGQYAALFAQGREPGTIALIPDGACSEADRSAFQAGIAKQNPDAASFVEAVNQPVGSALVMGTAQVSSFLDSNPTTPLVLISWIDPALTSRSVKVIFDDSIWMCAGAGIKAAKTGKDALVPAHTLIVSGRIAKTISRSQVQKIKKEFL
jgi:hypothetical protein